jgi:hypothetical protein
MRLSAALLIGLSTMVSAACATGGAQPQSSASSAGTATGGPVAACVVGEWTSAQLTTQASSPAGEASVSGGGGLILRVSGNGRAEVDFTAMDPVRFSVTNGEASLGGQFRYSGHATGQIRTGDATSTMGTWEPVGKADFSDVRITVDLSDPVKARPFDNVPLSPLIAGDSQAGGVVQADPVLGRANYTCGTNTLTLARPEALGLTWQLSRKP